METQNLNALVHLESLAAPMENITKTITVTEAQMKQETDELTSTIRDLEVRCRSEIFFLSCFRKRDVYKRTSH